jgi:hypothetical protein
MNFDEVSSRLIIRLHTPPKARTFLGRRRDVRGVGEGLVILDAHVREENSLKKRLFPGFGKKEVRFFTSY